MIDTYLLYSDARTLCVQESSSILMCFWQKILFCFADLTGSYNIASLKNTFYNLPRQNICYNQFFYYFSEEMKRIAQKARSFPAVAVFPACGGLLLTVNPPAFFLLYGECDIWLMPKLAVS